LTIFGVHATLESGRKRPPLTTDRLKVLLPQALEGFDLARTSAGTAVALS
jgi:hypothetical protein